MSRFDRLEFVSARTASSTKRVEPDLPAVERAPDHDEHHWYRKATEERRNGQYESALRYYARALEADRALVAGWVGQVQMLIALQEYPEADLWSRKALELFKNNAELLAGRCQALCRVGDLKSAQAAGDAAINQQGTAAYPWIARGELMLARREPLDDYCFDKALGLNGDWLVCMEVGDIYLHYRRPTKALAHVRRAVERAPERAHCWFRQGECERTLGLTGPAIRTFQRCVQLNPKHAVARSRLDELSKGGSPIRTLRRWLKLS